MKALKQLQKDFDDNTEVERKNLDDLRGILKNEEAGALTAAFNSSGGFTSTGPATVVNPVIMQALEKLKQMTS